MNKPSASSPSRPASHDYDASDAEWVLPSGQDLIAFALGVGLAPADWEARPTRSPRRRRSTDGHDALRVSKSGLK